MQTKTLYAVWVVGSGFVVMQPNCISFTDSLETAEMFMSPKQASDAIESYDFDSVMVMPVSMLILSDDKVEQSASLSLRFKIDDKEVPIFTAPLVGNRADIFGSARSAASVLSVLFRES